MSEWRQQYRRVFPRNVGFVGSFERFWPNLRTGLARRYAEICVNHRLVVGDLIVTGLGAALTVVLFAQIANRSLIDAGAWPFVLTALAVAIPVYPILGFYRRHTRSTSVGDTFIVSRGIGITVLLQGAILYALPVMPPLPLALFAIEFLAILPMLLALRLAARHREVLRRMARIRATSNVADDERMRVLLVGTGPSCDLFVRSTRSPASRYKPIGIIDDARDTLGLVFHDVDIVGSLLRPERLVKTLDRLDVLPNRIYLTEPITHLDSEGVRQVLRWGKAHGVSVSQLPNLGEVDPGGAPGFGEPRAVDPEEVLDRNQKVVERSLLRETFSDRRVLITGAGGSIGAELSRQIASFQPRELVLIEECEFNAYTIDQDLEQYFPNVRRRLHLANIRDANRINGIFQRHMPELVFNAAALKHVPLVEMNPAEGVLTNVIGTRNVADAARAYGAAAMVQVSTDKAVNTSNAMGATKRVAEFYVQAQDRITSETDEATRFFSVRFGNVLGSSGSIIPLFQKQISQGGPLTITDPEMTRYFMTLREAVELTLVAAAKGLAQKTGLGQIFVLDMGEPVKILDIAHRMIRLAGLEAGKDIKIETIGIRPGEKLFEELFDATEEPLDCGMPSIKAAAPAGVPISRLRRAIHKLETAALRGDDHGVKALMRDLVPGYSNACGEDHAPANEASRPRRKRAKHAFTTVRGPMPAAARRELGL